MGLKDDIYTALITNIQPEGVEENFNFTDKANQKVETLAQDLTNAIINWVQSQEFTITSLNATQLNAPVITPTGPGTAPMITVKVDENSAAPDNPLSGVESLSRGLGNLNQSKTLLSVCLSTFQIYR